MSESSRLVGTPRIFAGKLVIIVVQDQGHVGLISCISKR